MVAPVPDVVAPVPDVVAPVAEVVAPVAEVVAPVAEVVAPVAEVVAPVSEVVAPVSEVVAPVFDVVAPVFDVVAPVFDVVVPVRGGGAGSRGGGAGSRWWRRFSMWWRRFSMWWRRFSMWWRRARPSVSSRRGCLAGSVGAVIAVRGGTAGTGIGNGDRAPGTHQQARCEHANTCSKAQRQQTHLLLPTSHRRLARQSQRLPHCRIVRPSGIGQQAKYVHSTISSNTCLDVRYVDERGELCRR